eukprot:1316897-Amorphochlora_amoeboformis.AAC.2
MTSSTENPSFSPTIHPLTEAPSWLPTTVPHVTTLSPTQNPINPTNPPISLPTAFPTASPSPVLRMDLFANSHLGECGNVEIRTSIQTSGSNPRVTWYLNGALINSSAASNDGLSLAYGELLTLAFDLGITLTDGEILDFAGSLSDSSIALTTPLTHVYITHQSTMRPSLVLSSPLSRSDSVSPSLPLTLKASLIHSQCAKFSASVISTLGNSLEVEWQVLMNGVSIWLENSKDLVLVIPPGSLIPSKLHQ